MKKHITTTLFIITLLAGLSLLLYPTVSDWWNSFHQSRAIAGYSEAVSGLDAENESVEWVWSGRQYSTVAKPTNALVGETVSIIDSLLSGNGMPATDVTANNGVIDVPIYELPPVVVTKENAKEVFADDPDRMALLTD